MLKRILINTVSKIHKNLQWLTFAHSNHLQQHAQRIHQIITGNKQQSSRHNRQRQPSNPYPNNSSSKQITSHISALLLKVKSSISRLLSTLSTFAQQSSILFRAKPAANLKDKPPQLRSAFSPEDKAAIALLATNRDQKILNADPQKKRTMINTINAQLHAWLLILNFSTLRQQELQQTQAMTPTEPVTNTMSTPKTTSSYEHLLRKATPCSTIQHQSDSEQHFASDQIIVEYESSKRIQATLPEIRQKLSWGQPERSDNNTSQWCLSWPQTNHLQTATLPNSSQPFIDPTNPIRKIKIITTTVGMFAPRKKPQILPSPKVLFPEYSPNRPQLK